MMQWSEVSGEARETMRFLGHFQPTVTPEHKLVKGSLADDERCI